MQDIERRLNTFRDATLAFEIDLRLPERLSNDISPPPYDEAISDLPPDYSVASPLAQRRTWAYETGVEEIRGSKTRSSHQVIDFESPFGIREHKGKKKKGAAAKPAAPPPTNDPPPPPPEENSDRPDDGGGDAGGSGDGNGDDGNNGDDDGWGDPWGTATSSKMKKQQKKEEEERLAKEEEERKAQEEADAAKNTGLSWADDADGDNDDSWAGVGAGKKKKKGKVCTYYCSCFINVDC